MSTTTGSPFRSDAAAIDRSLAVRASAARHIDSEFGNSTDAILETIDVDGPLCFAANAPQADGFHRLACMSTVPEVRAHYDGMREALDVISFQSFTSLSRDWMLFEQGMTTFRDVASGATVVTDAIVLFPASEEKIHGELGWVIHQGARLGDPRADGEDAPNPLVKVGNRELHTRLVDAFRVGDVDAICAELDGDVGVGVRDYASGGPYRALQGIDAARAHYQTFYATFEVESLDVVAAIAGDWFLFSELSWVLRRRIGADAGQRVRCSTATMYPLMQDGGITVVIGYGSDFVPS